MPLEFFPLHGGAQIENDYLVILISNEEMLSFLVESHIWEAFEERLQTTCGDFLAEFSDVWFVGIEAPAL